MDADERELILYPSRWKLVLGLVASTAVATGGVLMIRDNAPGGWFVAIFFASCAGIFGIQMMPGASYLRLSRDGFVFSTLVRRSRDYRWAEVSEFRVVRVPGSGMKTVAFDAPLGGKLREWSRALVGATDGLPDSYGLKPEQLCTLLNDWRRRVPAIPRGAF